MQLPKIVAVGIYNSRTVAKNTAVSKNRKTSMFEIELPMETGGVSYIDDNTCPIDTHTLICAKPGQARHTRFPFKCYYVHLLVPEGTVHNLLTDIPDFIPTNRRDDYHSLFQRMFHLYSNPSAGDELLLQSLLLELIHTLRHDAERSLRIHQTGNSHFRVEEVLEYIQNNLTEDLRLETVAKTHSLSAVHFHNSFKAAVGMTLRDYVEEQRVRRAVTLLQTTDLSLTQVAFECGFSSQSYFSFVFKRRMYTTPRQYVRELNRRYEI